MPHKEEVIWENMSIRFLGIFLSGPCYLINKDKNFHGFISVEDGLWEYSLRTEGIKINKKPESTSELPPRNWVFPELINKFYGK
tara:strand:- start:224 stop:475 length:252 start_codon:yes stop_codon:yes gene_type:complete